MTRPLERYEILEEEHFALYNEKIRYWEIHESDIRDAEVVAAAARIDIPAEIPEHVKRQWLAAAVNEKLEGKDTRLDLDAKCGDALAPLSRTRFEAYIRAVHQRGDTSALCISGGGIRSATFALGLLQGLARRNVLDKFDFLSTVSGGGYIGGWLSSWMRRHPQGPRGVATELAKVPDDPAHPEPEPVRHLRAYSNYLTPKLGVGSGDTWALIATYIRNVLLNWTILIPLLLTILLLPRLVAALYFGNPVADFAHRAEDIAVLSSIATALPEVTHGKLLAVGAFFTAIALIFLGFARPFDNRYKTRTASDKNPDGTFITWCLLPLVIGSVFLAAAWVRWAGANGEQRFPRSALWLMVGAPLLIFVIHTIRLWRTDAAERRESVLAEVRERKSLWRRSRRFRYELSAAITGGLASWGLLRLCATKLHPQPAAGLEMTVAATLPSLMTASQPALYVCFAVPLILGALLVSATLFVGVSSEVNADYDREWWARSAGWVLAAMAAWPLLCLVVAFGPVLIWLAPELIAPIGGVTGFVTILLGRSASTAAKKGEEKSPLSNIVAKALAPAVIVFILSCLSLLTSVVVIRADRIQPFAEVAGRPVQALNHLRAFYSSSLSMLGLVALVLAAVVFAGSRVINVNKFSMHAMYRNRLIRAYLGASRDERDPNPFTGFDQHDNLAMHALRPELLWGTSFRDYQGFHDRLCYPSTSFDKALRREIDERKPQLFTKIEDHDARRDALFQIVNCVLEEENLATIENGPMRAQRQRSLYARVSEAAMRAVRGTGDGGHEVRGDITLLRRNRRVLEAQFPSELIPFDLPLLHRAEIGDSMEFIKSLRTPFGQKVVAQFRDTTVASRLVLTDRSYPKVLAATIDEINHAMQTTVDFEEKIDAATPEQIRRNRGLLDRHLAIHPLRTSRPMHVVNAALNLVSGDNLAWQERKAESFTFSPLHAGNAALGYRPANEYGGTAGVSVGTAVTISGAAASPNMGYHSSAPLAFLLTMFNVRLGWWLGNPGRPGDDFYMRDSPRHALAPLAAELTGSTNNDYAYVYLSDGGHFENLGLYEMVYRRRHHILVSDAGCDPDHQFEDLGNAIRKIRMDFGIPIEMEEPMYLYPRRNEKTGKYCAFGRILYSCVDPGAPDGELLYIKPAVYNEEPKDVYNYSRTSAAFPHESTGDQFFSETQFESYRMLGSHVIDEISQHAADRLTDDPKLKRIALSNWTASSIADFFAVVREYVGKGQQARAEAPATQAKMQIRRERRRWPRPEGSPSFAGTQPQSTSSGDQPETPRET